MSSNFLKKTGIFLLQVIFLFQSISVFSNLPAKENNKHIHNQEFRFRPGVQSGSDHVMNTLLQIIADGNQKLRVFTQYYLTCNIIVEAFAAGNNTGKLNLNLNDVRVKGETTYRYFDLEQWLTPSLLDISIKIKNEGNSVLRELKFTCLNWQDENFSEKDLKFNMNGFPPLSELELEISSVNFRYPDDFFYDVVSLQKALMEYYDAEGQINKVNSIIHELDQISPETVILDEFRLCDAEGTIGRLRYAAFQDFSMITDSDPESHIESISQLWTDLKKMRKKFNFIISHIDSLLHEQGLIFLEREEIGKARSAFERAVSYNNLFIPAQLSLASMELEDGMPEMVLNRLAKFMGQVHPPTYWINDITSFSQKLFEKEIERAGKLAADDRFLDALRILDELDGFCCKINIWECPAELQRSLIDVHYGMYRSYLRVAGRAYESGNFPFAVTYIESARQYQKENRQYISSKHESTRLLQDVADAYFFSADRAMLYYDYAMAVKMLKEARDLCQNYPELACRTDIENQLAQAETKKEDAAIYKAEYIVTEPMVIVPGSGKKHALSIVKDELSLGHLKAWAGETEEARAILNHVIEYAIRYDLRSDTLINMRIISLTEMIHQKECELGEREIEKLLQTIRGRLKDDHFLSANNDYQQARSLIAKNENCNWSYSDAMTELNYIPTLAKYQELLQESQGAYFRGTREGFDDFFHIYSLASDFFSKNNLKSYGADHEPLIDFVAGSSNISLMKAAVYFFAHRNEHESAFLTLQALKDNRLDAREVRALQELAGKRAAISISAQDTKLQPSGYVRELTANDSWYRFYVRSFIKNW